LLEGEDMAKVWVDPPAGWRFGFPAVWDSSEEPNVVKWILDKGYPEELVKEYGEYFYVRQWEWKEGDE
jgi:hypothetical protein